MKSVVVLSICFARGAWGKIGGEAENILTAQAFVGFETEARSHASAISERKIETLYKSTGAGLLGDLNANGVNQYLIENEASIERVDLDTVKTEFLDIYYTPSYTLDEPKAKDYEWYDTAMDLRGKINNIAKIRAKLSKMEKRLRKSTLIVVSKTNLQRSDTKELLQEPNAALVDKFTGLADAASKFQEFVKNGYPSGAHDFFDVVPSLLQSDQKDPKDELRNTIKSAEHLANGMATPEQLQTKNKAEGATTLFHSGVSHTCSKMEDSSKEKMAKVTDEASTAPELAPEFFGNLVTYFKSFNPPDFEANWKLLTDELRGAKSVKQALEMGQGDLNTCCSTLLKEKCCSNKPRQSATQCLQEKIGKCGNASTFMPSGSEETVGAWLEECPADTTANGGTASQPAQISTKKECAATDAQTMCACALDDKGLKTVSTKTSAECKVELDKECDTATSASMLIGDAACKSFKNGLLQTFSNTEDNCDAHRVQLIPKEKDVAEASLKIESATQNMIHYLRDKYDGENKEIAKYVGVENKIVKDCKVPQAGIKKIVTKLLDAVFALKAGDIVSALGDDASNFLQTQTQTDTAGNNPLLILQKQGEVVMALTAAITESGAPSDFAVKKFGRTTGMAAGKGLRNNILTAACCLKPKSGAFAYHKGGFSKSFVHSSCPQIYLCYASSLLNSVTGFIRMQNSMLANQMVSDSMRKIAGDVNTGGPFKAAYYNDVSKYTIEKILRAKDDDPSEGVMTAYMMRHEGKYCAYVLISHLRDDTMTKILAVLSDKKVPKADTVLILYALALELNAHPEDQLRKFSTDARFGGLVSYWRKFKFEPYTFIPDKDLTPEGNDWELWHKKIKMEAERTKVAKIDAYDILNLKKASADSGGESESEKEGEA